MVVSAPQIDQGLALELAKPAETARIKLVEKRLF
jgi:hypothetical protein